MRKTTAMDWGSDDVKTKKKRADGQTCFLV